MKKALTYIILVLFIFGLGFAFAYFLRQKEIFRISGNYSAQLTGLKYSLDSLRTDIAPLRLTVNDIQESLPQLKEDLKNDFDIKLKRAKVITNTVIETKEKFTTIVRDSINEVKAEIAEYHNEWTDFFWYKTSDTAQVEFINIDSIAGVLHKEPRSFWKWITGKPKKYLWSVKNYNPNSRITHSRYIQVE